MIPLSPLLGDPRDEDPKSGESKIKADALILEIFARSSLLLSFLLLVLSPPDLLS